MRALATVPTGMPAGKRRADDGPEAPPTKKVPRSAAAAAGQKRPGEARGKASAKRAQGADAATTEADDAFNEQVDKKVPKDREGVRVDPEIKEKNGYWDPDVDEDDRVMDPPPQKPCCTNPNSR
jgi:hypothetical protein